MTADERGVPQGTLFFVPSTLPEEPVELSHSMVFDYLSLLVAADARKALKFVFLFADLVMRSEPPGVGCYYFNGLLKPPAPTGYCFFQPPKL